MSGDRKYKAEDMALHFSKVLTNGVMPSGTQLQATADSGMNIIVSAGSAWINGYAYHNDSNFTLTIDPADGVLNRIDRIVVRWSRLDRAINLVVIKGVAASTPAAPAIVRGVDSYDLGIATISVGNGITSITQAMITDTRADNAVCGFVGSLIQPDTSGWFAQFDTAFNDAISENQSNWAAWFATVQDILDENTAGNLLNLINDLDDAKTDKVTSAVAGNLAGLDADGNLVDSGKSTTDFLQNKNLLKNGYFLNPKNTLGLTAYITDGSTIDNWTSYLVDVVTLTTGLYLTARTGVDARFWQSIAGLDLAKTYTLSILIGDTVYAVTGSPTAAATNVIIPGQAYLSLTTSGGDAAVMLGVSQGVTLTAVKAMKLELGSVSTLVSIDANGDIGEPQIPAENYANKANRKIPATAGNLATLITNGDLGDSGVAAADVYRKIPTPGAVNIKDYVAGLGYSGCGHAEPTTSGFPIASVYWNFTVHYATPGRIVLEVIQASTPNIKYYCVNTDGTWSGWYKITATAV